MKAKKIAGMLCVLATMMWGMAACHSEVPFVSDSDPTHTGPSTSVRGSEGSTAGSSSPASSDSQTTESSNSGRTTVGTTAVQPKGELEFSLTQWHPGIPGYDAVYPLTVKYSGLYVNAEDIHIESETDGVRIVDSSAIVPETVRERGVSVRLTAHYTPTGQTASLEIPVKPWRKVFGDEFEGTTLDMSQWSFSTGGTSTCVAVPDSFVMRDGKIQLQLNRRTVTQDGKTYDYVSTSLNTSQTFKTMYGCFLVNFKSTSFGGLNMGCSVYPVGAYSKNYLFFKKSNPKLGCAEIDPIEMSANWDNHYYVSEHFYDYTSRYEHSSLTSYVDVESSASDQFHTYGVVWQEEGMYYYCDGRLVRVNEDVTAKGVGGTEARRGFLNLGLGVDEPTGSWCGDWTFTDEDLPISMDVDWVRIYQ